MSYAQSGKIELVNKKAQARPTSRAYLVCLQEFARNPFVCTNLAASILLNHCKQKTYQVDPPGGYPLNPVRGLKAMPIALQPNIKESDALIVIDLQNDFCPAVNGIGGALAVDEGDTIIPRINSLAARFPHVILTQDCPPARHISFASTHTRQPYETIAAPYGAQTLWPDHCLQNSPGAAFHPALQIPHAELILRKGFRQSIDSYSAFLEND